MAEGDAQIIDTTAHQFNGHLQRRGLPPITPGIHILGPEDPEYRRHSTSRRTSPHP